MEKSKSRDPKPNEFVIPDTEVYAVTDVKTWEVIEFLMTKLEPVNLGDLDPNDRVCVICQLEFCVSKCARLSRPPVKTVCGHVFCEKCIIKWLDPLEDTDPLLFEKDTDYEKSNTSCPVCRNAFSSRYIDREPMEELAAHLWIWDNAYAFAGVARSEKEEYSRKSLWKYVNYCRSNYEFNPSDDVKVKLLRSAQTDLFYFAQELKTQSLTPVQERLRKLLEKIGEDGLTKTIRNAGKNSYFSYAFDPMSLLEEEEEEDYDPMPLDEEENEEENEEEEEEEEEEDFDPMSLDEEDEDGEEEDEDDEDEEAEEA